MNINDFSDTYAVLPEKPASKNKRTIVIIILLVLAVAVVSCLLIFYDNTSDNSKNKEEIYKKYVEPIITNDKLTKEKQGPFSDELYTYAPPEGGIAYSVSYDEENGFIQIQVIQSVIVDEKFKPITDHCMDLVYYYNYGKNEGPIFKVNFSEISESEIEKEMYDEPLIAELTLNTDLELTEGIGTENRNDSKRELSEIEIRDLYEKCKGEITELCGKLYALFGEENFTK